MKKLKVVLVDDEENLRDFLKSLLTQFTDDVEVVGEAANITDGELLINTTKPDLVFLDVEMPSGTGFSLLKKLEVKPLIVFVTAHEQYAIKAIKAGAIDYLLKPIDLDELLECIEKIRSNIELSNLDSPPSPPSTTAFDEITFKITTRETVLFIKQKEITRVEADGAYSHIYLVDGKKHTVSKNLKDIESQLDKYVFMRCHASYLVNLYKVTKLLKGDNTALILSDNSKVDISRRFKSDFIERLNDVLSS